MLTNVKLGKTLRGVSIVGIGATPFFNGVENPAYKGITNGELFGHAALAAMKDADFSASRIKATAMTASSRPI